MSLRRRSFILGSILGLTVAIAACKKEERCKTCGMKIDRSSPWRTELVLDDASTSSFDTPRCAFIAWRSGKMQAKSIRVQEYYERTWRDGAEVRFLVGGDVIGPMGPDLVPVDASRATKFIQDHHADRALRLEEVTAESLSNIK